MSHVKSGTGPSNVLIMDETTNEAIDFTDADLLDDELLIEEISIDGMCGVY